MTQVKMTDINVGDYIFIGSRWHRINTVQRAGEDYEVPDYSQYRVFSDKLPMLTKQYPKDLIRTKCYEDYLEPYDYKNGGYKNRPLPDAEYVKPADAAFPKCKHCEGTEKTPYNGGKPRGNYLFLSEIMDIPAVREKIEKKFTKTWSSGRTVKVEPRFRIIDDRVKE